MAALRKEHSKFHREHQLQAAAFVWMKKALPEFSVVFSVDVGGEGDAISWAVAKQRGITAGTSDMFAIVCAYIPRIFAIELKVLGNTPTENQTRFGENINRAGGIFLVAYSTSELKAHFIRHGVSLRETEMSTEEIDQRLAAKAQKRYALKGVVRRTDPLRTRAQEIMRTDPFVGG